MSRYVFLLGCLLLGACSTQPGSEADPCPEGALPCGGSCVDLSLDPRHCGACGAACPEDQVCSGGSCQADCGPERLRCDGLCRDPQGDPQHCGACGVACGTGELCLGGACVRSCEGEGGVLCGDRCIDPEADSAHCGGCGQACQEGQACVEGSCACPEGQQVCDRRCSAIADDPEHCGGCGQRCEAGENAVHARCEEGSCTLSCMEGWGDCDGDPSNGCEENVYLSDANCGACGSACALGGCVGGECLCPAGTQPCEDACVVLEEDPANCGGCGNDCAVGAVHASVFCVAGQCSFACEDGFLDCDAAVPGCETSIVADRANCGGCGQVCGNEQVCEEERCVCLPGAGLTCGTECVDETRDPYNCGACGTFCPLGCGDGDCGRIAQVSPTSFSHICLTSTRKEAFCWGGNDFGQLGNGEGGTFLAQEQRPVRVEGVEGVEEIASGRYHSCALLQEGRVACWGANENGQAGPLGDRNQLLPQRILDEEGEELRGVRQLALFHEASCALLEEREVVCWGNPENGRLGNGATARGVTPFPVRVEIADGVPLRGVRALGAGHQHICAVLEDGGLRCWGKNGRGQALPGTTADQPRPALVPGISQVKQVVGGHQRTTILREDGVVRWWGNLLGTNSDIPVEVPELRDVVQISGAMFHDCALREAGSAWCWGDNDGSKLGDGNTTSSLLPVQVQSAPGSPLLGVAGVQAGQVHSCVWLVSGEMLCWGRNYNGSLGSGNGNDQRWPAPVQF